MRIHYDDELAGHFGRDKTEALLRRKYCVLSDEDEAPSSIWRSAGASYTKPPLAGNHDGFYYRSAAGQHEGTSSGCNTGYCGSIFKDEQIYCDN
ncbi:hypothetical protein M433DRAFT_9203 [Acidomyces richmondensis BFW]|nr:hypothetical protein M433DRAFT_9203 [Acidomyces richmondensis BFW]